jgi:xylulokinase
VRKSFGLDHETITRLAKEEAAGCEGVNFLPFLTGERTPNWPHSSGVITGLRPGGMRPGLLYRAALEGATFSLLNGAQPPLSQRSV